MFSIPICMISYINDKTTSVQILWAERVHKLFD